MRHLYLLRLGIELLVDSCLKETRGGNFIYVVNTECLVETINLHYHIAILIVFLECEFIDLFEDFQVRLHPWVLLFEYWRFRAFLKEPADERHYVLHLLDLILPIEPMWTALRPAMARITAYGVEYRYPGRTATSAETTSLLKTTAYVRELIRSSLGLN